MNLVVVKYPGSTTFDQANKKWWVTSPRWEAMHLHGPCLHSERPNMVIVEDKNGGIHVVNKEIVEPLNVPCDCAQKHYLDNQHSSDCLSLVGLS